MNIVVVEDSNYYNHIIEDQISDILISKKTPGIQFDIRSVLNVDEILKTKNNNYQVIIFDNHFKNNRQQADYNVMEIIDDMKVKNNNCFFISISGYREMNISAYLYKDGEMRFTYAKQFAFRNENYEESCSIPSLQKLMERYIDGLLIDMNQSAQRIAA